MKVWCGFCGTKKILGIDTYLISTVKVKQNHCKDCGRPIRERPQGLGFRRGEYVRRNVITERDIARRR